MNHIFPPGIYYIGDVTLALSPYNQSLTNRMGIHKVKTDEGNEFEYIVAGVKNGNGVYEASNGKQFIVVKNNIGMVPIYLLNEEQLDEDHYMDLYEFPYYVVFKWLDGVFSISSGDFKMVIVS